MNPYRGAIEVIQRRGWSSHPGSSYGLDGRSPVCIVGALCVATGQRPVSVEHAETIVDPLKEIISEQFHENGISLSAWNDTHGTEEKVVLALEKAAGQCDELVQ